MKKVRSLIQEEVVRSIKQHSVGVLSHGSKIAGILSFLQLK